MKLRAVMVALTLAAVGAGVSAAIAAPSAVKGKPPSTGSGCRPQIALILKGKLGAAPGATGTSLTLYVSQANGHGAAYAKVNQPILVLVTSSTVVRRQGQKTLRDLVSGDRVLVQSRACKADLANGATPNLTATRIVAHPAAT